MKKFYVFSLLCCLSMALWAVPAKRVLHRLQMADGTTVRAMLYGDEHFSWYESTDGRVLTETEAGYVFSDEQPTEVRSKARAARRANVLKIGSQAEAALPAQGSPRIPVILVSFSDSVFHVEPLTDAWLMAYYDLYCNGWRDGERYKDHGSYGAVRDYFVDQSRGVFTPEFEVVAHVKLDNPESTYGRNSSSRKGSDAGFSALCKDAVTKAMEQWQGDWMQFSNRGKQRVDMVLIIFAGCGEHEGADASLMWPKWSSLNVKVNDVTFHSALCVSENMPILDDDDRVVDVEPEGIGVLCHELNHALGLPDFYDTNYKAFGMDIWSIMDYGQYADNGYTPVAMTAYEREFMGWEEIETLTSPGWYTLLPTSTTGKGYKIVNPENANEYYVLENRQRASWDKAVGRIGHGLMVTHVDYNASRWGNNSVNTDANHQRMTIIAANNRYVGTCVPNVTGYELIETWSGNLFPYEENDSLTANSVPAATVFTSRGYMRQDLNAIMENEDEWKTVSFYFGNNYFVGIQAPEVQGIPSDNVVYDLSGRRVAKPGKGIYIVGGRKIVFQ